MSELDQACMQPMYHVVFKENRYFSYLDFLCFKVNGNEYKMTHGTFRNKVSNLMKIGVVSLVCHSAPALYTLKCSGRVSSRNDDDNRIMTPSVTGKTPWISLIGTNQPPAKQSTP
jgi:hypothetical protein